MSKRFLLTILTLVVIAIATGLAIFFAKGYRISPKDRIVAGTGIISVTSLPDQASVYLDGHLSTATNANINSLPPKTYDVKIIKDGYIPWAKKVEVKTGLVTDIKATLFPAIPTIYPLTFNGVQNAILSPDEQRLAYIVPSQDKKAGVWVWEMNDKSLGFTRGRQPHQIALPDPAIDYTKASLRWSPDSSQILATLPDRNLLLDIDRLNDAPRDITAVLGPTLSTWDSDQKAADQTLINTIKDPSLHQIASSAATMPIPASQIQWSPDQTKFLITETKANKSSSAPTFKVYDLVDKKSYDLPKALHYTWLPDSRHLISVDDNPDKAGESRLAVTEYDGQNVAVIYAGGFDKAHIYPWPDGSRVAIISTLPTPTASTPNLYGINLK